MVKASEVISEVQEVLALRKAIAEVQGNAWGLDLGVSKKKPEASDRSEPVVRKSMSTAIMTQVSGAQLKTDVLADLNAQLVALEAQYPCIVIEEG
jgi:hypothetical protein